MNYISTIKSLEREYNKKVTVKLKDLEGSFKDISNIEGNPVIYKVFIKKYSPINLGLTILNSGSVNREFYMTRGHVHKKQSPEFYILMEGKGILLIQKRSIIKKIVLEKGQIALVPEDYAHRLINVGKEKLKALTIYDETSMPNYKVKFRKRFFKK